MSLIFGRPVCMFSSLLLYDIQTYSMHVDGHFQVYNVFYCFHVYCPDPNGHVLMTPPLITSQGPIWKVYNRLVSTEAYV